MKKFQATEPIITELVGFCTSELLKNPQNTDLLQLQGVLYLTINELTKAQNDFEKVLQIDPENKKAYYLLSRAHYEQLEFDRALRDFLRALVKAGDSADEEFIKHATESDIKKRKVKGVETIEDIGKITEQEIKTFLADIMNNVHVPNIAKFLQVYFQ